jgi:hypothetical protein
MGLWVFGGIAFAGGATFYKLMEQASREKKRELALKYAFATVAAFILPLASPKLVYKFTGYHVADVIYPDPYLDMSFAIPRGKGPWKKIVADVQQEFQLSTRQAELSLLDALYEIPNAKDVNPDNVYQTAAKTLRKIDRPSLK